MISFSTLPPLYSTAYPFLKNFKVGKPFTLNFPEHSFSTVASTLAKATGVSEVFNTLAAFSYSGASFLQCPHQGA